MAPHGQCCGDNHQHSESPGIGIQYSLYSKINTDSLKSLNEGSEGSGRKVFKPWEDRLNKDFVDADEELLFNIPFTGNVKLKGIIIVGEDPDMHPNRMRLFKNRPSMTFDDISGEPDQNFELHHDINGILKYNTRVVTFNILHHLTKHFPSNSGTDVTKIHCIGLKGEYAEPHHHGVAICNYEARPNIADHKNPLRDNVSHQTQ